IDMACDVASVYGVSFDPDDAGEIATLFAIALGVEAKQGGDENRGGNGKSEAQGMTERLIALEEGEVATRIGRKLLEESVMRNAIPVVGIAVSARWNHAATHMLGRKVSRYVRYRRAIHRAFGRLDCAAAYDPHILLEGAWLIVTSDGEPTHEEVMA